MVLFTTCALCVSVSDHRLPAIWKVSGLVGFWSFALRDAGWAGKSYDKPDQAGPRQGICAFLAFSHSLCFISSLLLAVNHLSLSQGQFLLITLCKSPETNGKYFMPIGLSQLFMNCSETSQALNTREKSLNCFQRRLLLLSCPDKRTS